MIAEKRENQQETKRPIQSKEEESEFQTSQRKKETEGWNF